MPHAFQSSLSHPICSRFGGRDVLLCAASAKTSGSVMRQSCYPNRNRDHLACRTFSIPIFLTCEPSTSAGAKPLCRLRACTGCSLRAYCGTHLDRQTGPPSSYRNKLESKSAQQETIPTPVAPRDENTPKRKKSPQLHWMQVFCLGCRKAMQGMQTT